jgi:hypothetical protein
LIVFERLKKRTKEEIKLPFINAVHNPRPDRFISKQEIHCDLQLNDGKYATLKELSSLISTEL